MKLLLSKILLTVALFGLFNNDIYSQKKEKTDVSFRDSLDHAFDVSDWIITKKGFVPWPTIITEPSLGGFGGGVGAVFITPHAPRMVDGKAYPSMPDITMIGAMYTLNDTWGLMAGRMGSIPKWGLRYRVGSGYMNVNMNFYHDIPSVGDDVKMEFNGKVIPAYIYVGKMLHNPRFTIGMDYLFMYSRLKLRDPDAVLPDVITDKEMDSHVSNLGLQFDFDTRDNTFTPDKGVKAYVHSRWSNSVIGSDYDYINLEGAMYSFLNYGAKRNFVTGLRLDVQQVFGSAPFYLKPFIDMRGVPAERYQGKSTVLIEAEQRWDFTRRWSALAFIGTGKGFDSYSEFDAAEWAYSYGAGFRYLLARKLKLRVGVDLAMGPEGFSYYLVFGSSWSRQ